MTKFLVTPVRAMFCKRCWFLHNHSLYTKSLSQEIICIELNTAWLLSGSILLAELSDRWKKIYSVSEIWDLNLVASGFSDILWLTLNFDNQPSGAPFDNI